MSGAASTRPVPAWSERAIHELQVVTACPVCGASTLFESRCRTCQADLSEIGRELWQASRTAAAALEARQAVLDRVPRRTAPVAASLPPVTVASAQPVAAPQPVPAPVLPPRTGSSATVQSVLALAGAGLVAVAALVFTFFNPDLTDRGARTGIVALIAAAFLAGAFVLTRRRLRFSSEAVGGLGLVFVALTVGSLADGADARTAWTTAALGALVGGGGAAVAGAWARVRVWVALGAVAASLAPVLLGLSAGTTGGASVGALGTAIAASALVHAAPRVAGRFDGSLRVERVALTSVQAAGTVAAVLCALGSYAASTLELWGGTAAMLAAVAILSALSARHVAGGLWSVVTGAASVAAFVAAALAAGPPDAWMFTIVPASASVGLLAVAAIPLPRAVGRTPLRAGALSALAFAAVPTTSAGVLVCVATVLGVDDGSELFSPESVAAIAIGLGLLAAALALYGTGAVRLTRRRDAAPSASGSSWTLPTAAWFAAMAGLVGLIAPAVIPEVRGSLSLAVAIGAAFILTGVRRARGARLAVRVPLVTGAHAAAAPGIILSLRDLAPGDEGFVLGAGAAGVLALLALARTIPARGRFLHVGAAYAYALSTIGIALALAGVGALPLVCLLTTIAGAGAIVATFARRVPPRAWTAILVVTAVPFVAGVVQVIFERSAWTALSTTVIFLLALTLTGTRRPGLSRMVRVAAAGVLVPSLAVVAVCLGAQLLATSGAPAVLPVIAVLVAIALPARLPIRRAIAMRAGGPDAAASAFAIELSALVTAVIALVLALARESAGLGTALLVLVILAAGGAATALWAERRYGWWMAAACATGALWCAEALAGIDVVEAYVLPPAVGAVVVGAILTARGARPAVVLYATGLAFSVIPTLGLLAVRGSLGETPARAFALVTAAAALAAVGCLRPEGALARLRFPTLAFAVLAGAGGVVQALRWGLRLDAAPPGIPLVLACLGIGIAGALPAAIAGFALTRGEGAVRAGRWPYVPAVLFAAASAWTAIERDPLAIGAMWTLMLALSAGMVVVAERGRRRTTSLPPVWFVFALAFITAVVAWGPRELRVEWFSLPLGLFLLAAGALGLRGGTSSSSPRMSDWPRGYTGSWPLLAPGPVVLLSASIAATYTDPTTWRAILVMVVALAAIVVGAAARLAAPFLLGIIVLPVENALAFLVQIGRGIASLPWWITLSLVGAVLLTLAVTSERRTGQGAGIAARLRDLR